MVPAEFTDECGRPRSSARSSPSSRGGPGGASGDVGIRRGRDHGRCFGSTARYQTMKIKNSLKSLRSRHRDNRLVRRKGRVYVINKTNPRFKARQG